MCVNLYMEAIQTEIHKLRNTIEDLELKNNLLKQDYEKVRKENLKFRKLVSQLNKFLAKYIVEDE